MRHVVLSLACVALVAGSLSAADAKKKCVPVAEWRPSYPYCCIPAPTVCKPASNTADGPVGEPTLVKKTRSVFAPEPLAPTAVAAHEASVLAGITAGAVATAAGGVTASTPLATDAQAKRLVTITKLRNLLGVEASGSCTCKASSTFDINNPPAPPALAVCKCSPDGGPCVCESGCNCDCPCCQADARAARTPQRPIWNAWKGILFPFMKETPRVTVCE